MNNDLINKIKSKKIILFGKSLKIDDIKNYAKLLEYNDEELNDPQNPTYPYHIIPKESKVEYFIDGFPTHDPILIISCYYQLINSASSNINIYVIIYLINLNIK